MPPDLFMFLLVFMIGMFVGGAFIKSSVREEVIKKGYGKYVLIDGGPKVEFRWNDELEDK